MTTEESKDGKIEEARERILKAFLVYTPEELTSPIRDEIKPNTHWSDLSKEAADGLASVIAAATLPLQMVQMDVHRRRFERFHIAERIRIPNKPGSSDEQAKAYERAVQSMCNFLEEKDGREYVTRETIFELDSMLEANQISTAAREVLNQATISAWSVFETFASSFIRAWINAHPQAARPVLVLPELKNLFGRQTIDIDAIYDHGLDLSQSMGDVLFRGKRLDSLTVIRAVMDSLFSCKHIREALGDQMWSLNQSRHLLVHRRGIVDQEYKNRSGENVAIGERLPIDGDRLAQYIHTVQEAIIAISRAADRTG